MYGLPLSCLPERALSKSDTVPLQKRPHAVYRCYDQADALLYVGLAVDPRKRLRDHRRGQKQWTRHVARTAVEWFRCRNDAERVENSAIGSESPAANVHPGHNYGTGPLPRPERIETWPSLLPAR